MLPLDYQRTLNKIVGHMIPQQTYVFNATVERIVDGDTIDAKIDCGLHTYRLERLRLLRVNAPEMKGATIEAGKAARTFVTDWLGVDHSVVIQTYKSDVFGRFLCDLWRADGANLSDDLLSSGNAVVFTK